MARVRPVLHYPIFELVECYVEGRNKIFHKLVDGAHFTGGNIVLNALFGLFKLGVAAAALL